jgi:hypothetical protein
MARLDVYRLRGAKERYVVDAQSEWLSHLSTRTVVPLVAEGEIGDPVTDLNPKFELGWIRSYCFRSLSRLSRNQS